MDKPIKRKLKGLKSFSIFDLVLLAMLTAASVGFKVVVGNLVRMITGPLGVPGGALAGGFYMLWLPLAITLVGKRGSALLISLVQTIIMVTTGAPGSHGVWTVITYMGPAIFVELVYLYKPRDGYNILHFIISTMLANMVGTFGTSHLFFRLSIYPLLFTLLAASLSGALGGAIAYFVHTGIIKTGILTRLRAKTTIKFKSDEENVTWEQIDEEERLWIEKESAEKESKDNYENGFMQGEDNENENNIADKLEIKDKAWKEREDNEKDNSIADKWKIKDKAWKERLVYLS